MTTRLKGESVVLEPTSLPTSGIEGEIRFDTTTSSYKRWNGAEWADLGADYDQISTPVTPGSGKMKLYPKSDGFFYKLDENGVEVKVGSGGGLGEKNYIENPSAESDLTGWAESLDGAVDITRSTTAAELPREFTTETGIKFVATAAANPIAAQFSAALTGVTGTVQVTADNAGPGGNSISIATDGATTLATLISNYNAANPTKTVTLNSANGGDTPATSQSIALSGGEIGKFAHYRFSLDDSDYSRKLKIGFSQKEISGYVAGDFKVELRYNSQADYLGTWTDITIPNNSIASGDGDAIYTFDTDAVGIYYEFRVESTVATSTGVVISDVVLGPGKVIPGAAVGPTVDITPTSSWVANTTTAGKVTRYGQWGKFEFNNTLTGAPTASSLTFILPSGYTIDTTALTQMTPIRSVLHGDGAIFDANTLISYSTVPVYNDTTSVLVRFLDDASAGVSTNTLNATAPITFATGDKVNVTVWLPILEWADSTVNFINDEVAAQNIKARYYASGTTVGSSSPQFDTESSLLDTSSGFSISAQEITIPADGRYRITTSLFASTTLSGNTQIRLNIDTVFSHHFGSVVTGSSIACGSTTVDLLKNQTVKIVTGTTQNLALGESTFIEIVRVPDFTAGQAVGFGQASATEYGLVKNNNWKDISSYLSSPTAAGWSVATALGFAFQDASGNWAMHISIQATHNSLTGTLTVVLDGTSPSLTQSLSAYPNGTVFMVSKINASTGLVTTGATSARSGFMVSGTVPLTAKPTWAD